MSTVQTNRIQHSTGAGNNIQLDNQGNVVCAANIQSTSQNDSQLCGFRNELMNADFDVWTLWNADVTMGPTEGGNDGYALPRWHIANGSGVRFVREEGGPAPGSAYMAVRSNPAGGAEVGQGVEIINNANGRFEVGSTWTLSWWSTTDWTGTTCVFSFRDVGGLTTPVNAVPITGVPAPTANQTRVVGGVTWTQYRCTITINGNVSTASGTQSCLYVAVTLPAGDTDIALMQFERGPTATEFEYLNYATHVQRMQRYFYCYRLSTPGFAVLTPLVIPGAGRTKACKSVLLHPVQMKRTPTVRISPANTWRVNACGNNDEVATIASIGTVGDYSFSFELQSGSDKEPGAAGWLSREGSANTFITVLGDY